MECMFTQKKIPLRERDMSYETRLLIYSLLPILSSGIAQTELHYAYFTAGPGGGFDSSGSVPAVEIAEEQILRSETLLNGYRLTHTAVQDTKCNRTKSLDLFLSQIPSMDPPVLGLLGCGCSVASEPVAEIIHHWNISQIGYGSSSITLSEPRFRHFFRTHPSMVNVVPTIVSVLRHYHWNRVAFLTESEVLFTEIFDNTTELLRMKNITLREMIVTRNGSFTEQDYRIFFINTYSDLAVKIICQAYKRGLTYPRYSWLTYGWYQERWWTSEVHGLQLDCTDAQLSEFLDRSLSLQIFPTASDPSEMTDTGLSPDEFLAAYVKRLQSSNAQMKNYNFSFTFTAALAYDATWAFALALNKTAAMVNFTKEEVFNATGCRDDNENRTSNQIVPLESFTYDNGLMGCVIRYHLQHTYFKGVSGEVDFDEMGSRVQSQMMALQYRLEEDGGSVVRRQIGLINGNSSVFDADDTVFPAGIPPDGSPILQTVTYHRAFVIIFYILAVAGIIFTTVCLMFNFVFRKKKIVLLTSPKLNYFIITGAYMIYITSIIRIVPTRHKLFVSISCRLGSILFTIGFCLGFGTLLAKVFRIFQIFHKPCQKQKNLLRDWQLMIIIIIITGIGAFLALIGETVPQLTSAPQLRPNAENPYGENELGVRIEYQIWRCYVSANPKENAFFYIRLSYLSLLQIIGLVLAIQTRKVTVKALNDSKYIAALIYISSISLVVMALTTFTLNSYLHVSEVILTGSLLLNVTSFLCLTFIPKMVSLYHDPSGRKIFHRGNEYSVHIESIFSVVDERDVKISRLEARLSELESSQIPRENSIVRVMPEVDGENTEQEIMNNVNHTCTDVSHTCNGNNNIDIKKPRCVQLQAKETTV